jgi:hypothetical protein
MKIEAILNGCVVQKGRDVVLIATQPAAGAMCTNFHVLLGETWFNYSSEPSWAACAMAGVRYAGADDLVIVAASPDGHLWEMNPGTRDERLSRMSPEFAGLTALAAIGNAIWACGMGRKVWRREIAGTWVDRSVPPGSPEQGVVGFNAIAGLTDEALLAVGWQGEIWSMLNGVWTREDSGTDANLNAVSIGRDGTAMVAGDRGSLIAGRAGHWTPMSTGTTSDLKGVCHFGDEIFVCTDFEILRWQDNRLIPETRVAGDERPKPCMNFLVGGEGVYAQGEQNLYCFGPEGAWKRIVSISDRERARRPDPDS